MVVIYDHFIKLTSKHTRGVNSVSFLTIIRQFHHQSSIFLRFHVYLKVTHWALHRVYKLVFSHYLNSNLISTKWQLKCLANETDCKAETENYLWKKKDILHLQNRYLGISGRLTRNDFTFQNLLQYFFL